MRPKSQTRMRLLAWTCVLAVLLTAVSPTTAGALLAILPPAEAVPVDAGSCRLVLTAETPPAAPVVLSGVAPRAPPLA